MSNDRHETTYLVFRKEGESATGKTEVHSVNSRSSGAILGVIKWYGAWRQYCFFPADDTIFNRGCMEDINAHITRLMEARTPEPPRRGTNYLDPARTGEAPR